MATAGKIGVQSGTKAGKSLPMQQTAPGGGATGVAGGGLGAFSSAPNMPVTGIPNGVAQSYEFLATAVSKLDAAYAKLLQTAQPIPWDAYGNSVANATPKFDAFATSLAAVSQQLEALGKQRELINMLDRVSKVTTAVTSSRGLTVLSRAATGGNLTSPVYEMLGDQEIRAKAANGWSSQRLAGVGANSHEALQIYAGIQTQMIRSWKSGMSTIDDRVLAERKAQAKALKSDLQRLLDVVESDPYDSNTGRRLTAQERKFLLGDGTAKNPGNLALMQSDLKKVNAGLDTRTMADIPRITPMGKTIGAVSALMGDFRENRDMKVLHEAETQYQRAMKQLENEREGMTRADYLTYRSRLNVYGSQLGQLREDKKIDPLMAARQVRQGMSTLNAEMGLLRKGGIDAASVQGRLGEVQALFDTYGPWMNAGTMAQYSALLKTKGLELAPYTGPQMADALGAAKAIQRGFRMTGNYNAEDVAKAKAALTGQEAIYKAIKADEKANPAARADAEKQLESISKAMGALNQITNSTNKALGGMFGTLSRAAGMAVGVYSLTHAFSQAFSRALEFNGALKQIEAQLRKLPQNERGALRDSIKQGAIEDALNYGVDLSTAVHARTATMLGSKGSIESRERLARTMTQLAFVNPQQHQDFQAMIAPLTNAGLGAGDINRFMQSTQVLQGQYQMTPDRFRAMMQSIASGAGGLNAFTDWDTLRAVSLQEAVSTRDRMMGSKLNRIQTTFRNGKSLQRIQEILSRGGSRDNIDGLSIQEITADGNPMLGIDRISKLYRSGAIGDAEVSAIAQIMDKRSSPSLMNMLRTGLDEWRGKVHEADALAAGGFVSTDEMAKKTGESMSSSVSRFNQAIANTMTSGLNPLGRALSLLADTATTVSKAFGPLINAVGGLISSFALGMGAWKGVTAGYGAAKKFYTDTVNTEGATGFWSGLGKRGLSGSAGLIGLGVGAAFMIGGAIYDNYQQKKEAAYNEHNNWAAVAAVNVQREYDRGSQAITLIRELEELQAKGALTKEREQGAIESLTTALGNRKKAEELVLAVHNKQTAQLREQLEIISQMGVKTGGSEAAVSFAIAHNFGADAEDADAITESRDTMQKLYRLYKGGKMSEEQRSAFAAMVRDTVAINRKTGKVTNLWLDASNLSEDDIASVDGNIIAMWFDRLRDYANNHRNIQNEIFGTNKITPKKDKTLAQQQVAAAQVQYLAAVTRKAQLHMMPEATDSQLNNAVKAGDLSDIIHRYVFQGKAGVGIEQLDARLREALGNGIGTRLLASGNTLNRGLTFGNVGSALLRDSSILGDLQKKLGSHGIVPIIGKDGETKSYTDESVRRLVEIFYQDPKVAKELTTKYPGMAQLIERAKGTMVAEALVEAKVPNSSSESHMRANTPTVMNRWMNRYRHLEVVSKSAYGPGMDAAMSSLMDEEGNPKFLYDKKRWTFDLNEIQTKPENIHKLPETSVWKQAVIATNRDFDIRRKAAKGNPEVISAIDAEQKDRLAKLAEEMLALGSYVMSNPHIMRQSRFTAHDEMVKRLTFGAEEGARAEYASDLTSADGFTRAQATLKVRDRVLRAKAAASGKAGFLTHEELALRQSEYLGEQVTLRADASRAYMGARQATQDFRIWNRENASPVGIYAGDNELRQRQTTILNEQINLQKDYSDKLGTNNETLDEQIKITQNLVSMMRKRVELEEAVMRSQQAAAVGKEVQGQIVSTIFSFDGGSAADRGKNLLNILGNTATRGMVDGVNRVINNSDNPIAKAAAFLYDPTGALDTKYAQEKLTNATLELAQRIEMLTQLLQAREQGALATSNQLSSPLDQPKDENAKPGDKPTGKSALTRATGPSGIGLRQNINPVGELRSKADRTVAGTTSLIQTADAQGKPVSLALGDILLHGTGQQMSDAYKSNPSEFNTQMEKMGIKPADPSKGFTEKDAQINALAINQQQMARQNAARNNPLVGLFGGVQFGTNFWAAGGKGIGYFDGQEYTGWGAQNVYAPDGKTVVSGNAGISNTGMAVMGIQAAMAGISAYYGNAGNGQAAQNYAAVGSVATTAGAGVLGAVMAGGLANSWNPVGWSLLIVGAIASVMSGFEAAEHKADEAAKAYEKQRADYEKMIAIQEEQKKSIGLMAERVISMRGEVSSNFEGVAASSFLSGRWASRAPQINVATLTVVANNPAELSQALTSALTTQVRQGL